MQSLLITARLANGFVGSDPWSPTLDGILASAVMRERLGDDYALAATRPSEMQPVEGLPIERVEGGAWWWYACSSPIVPTAIRDRKAFHRRFDDTEAGSRLPTVRKVTDAAGPYKAYRLTETRTVVRQVAWHAVGEPGEIERLLRCIPAIGGGRARGHGEVVEWTVEPCGDPQLAHRHRPLPVDYARALGLDGPVMIAGLRPPARLPQNLCECVVPRAGA